MFIKWPIPSSACFALQFEARILMCPAAGECGNGLHESKMLSGLRCFSPKTALMMFKGQIAIAIDLHQFRRNA